MSDILISMLVFAFFLGCFSQYESSKSEKRYKMLETKYNGLALQTGHPELVTTFISEQDEAEIKRLKAQGKMVAAVKLARSLREMSLTDAKQYVDQL